MESTRFIAAWQLAACACIIIAGQCMGWNINTDAKLGIFLVAGLLLPHVAIFTMHLTGGGSMFALMNTGTALCIAMWSVFRPWERGIGGSGDIELVVVLGICTAYFATSMIAFGRGVRRLRATVAVTLTASIGITYGWITSSVWPLVAVAAVLGILAWRGDRPLTPSRISTMVLAC